jgi:predicted amidohydrolase
LYAGLQIEAFGQFMKEQGAEGMFTPEVHIEVQSLQNLQHEHWHRLAAHALDESCCFRIRE